MPTFRISSHGRLQDWIAIERGFFDDEGLKYEFDVRALENAAQDISATERHDIRVGAYELYLAGGGGKKNMSCACHWAVNQAAVDAAGKMWGHAYSVLPSGIYVPADSPIQRPHELADIEIAVGFRFHRPLHRQLPAALGAAHDECAGGIARERAIRLWQ